MKDFIYENWNTMLIATVLFLAVLGLATFICSLRYLGNLYGFRNGGTINVHGCQTFGDLVKASLMITGVVEVIVIIVVILLYFMVFRMLDLDFAKF